VGQTNQDRGAGGIKATLSNGSHVASRSHASPSEVAAGAFFQEAGLSAGVQAPGVPVALGADERGYVSFQGSTNAPAGGAVPGDCGESKTPLVTDKSRARIDLDALTEALPAVDTIVRYLHAADLASLSNATPNWRLAVTDHMFDQAAKADLAAREHDSHTPWPALVDSKFSTAADALSRRGFQHAATLINLHNAVEALPTLSLAGCRVTEVPHIYLSARAPVRSASGNLEFMAFRQGGSADISFITLAGQTRTPAGLVGHWPAANSTSHFVVVNSMHHCGRNDVFLTRDRERGQLGIYNVKTDSVELTGLMLSHEYDLAALSESATVVAVLRRRLDGSASRLTVVDRSTGKVLTNLHLGGVNQTGLSVDSTGTAYVADYVRRIKIPPGGARCSQSRLSEPNGLFTLGPGERHTLSWGTSSCEIVLRSLDGAGAITLKAPGMRGTGHLGVQARGFALSAGQAMAAVAYSDGSVAIFDLTGNESVLRNSRHFRMPHTFPYRDGPVLSFTRDGSALNIMCTKEDPSDPRAAIIGSGCVNLVGEPAESDRQRHADPSARAAHW
jgi:hypothetical protein